MTLKISLGEILEIAPVLSEMSAMRFKGTISFRLSRLISAFEKELILFQEEKNNITKKHYDNKTNLNQEELKIFETEINELLATIINLDITPIPENAFYEVNFTARQALILERIIEKPLSFERGYFF